MLFIMLVSYILTADYIYWMMGQYLIMINILSFQKYG